LVREHLLVEHALRQRQRIGVALEQALRDLLRLGVELIGRHRVVDDAHARQFLRREGTREHEIFLGHVHRHFQRRENGAAVTRDHAMIG
jgi:hypothetical protein